MVTCVQAEVDYTAALCWYSGPCIALCMGERGQPTRMLAAKYGGYLTFGALGGGKESAPGQPTLHQLKHMYRLPDLTSDCQVAVLCFALHADDMGHHRSSDKKLFKTVFWDSIGVVGA